MPDLAKYRQLLTAPGLTRRVARTAARSFDLGSYEQRLHAGAVGRPNYAYCLFHSARLAKQLGLRRVSAIEFGVAGGNGLVAMEQHAEQIGDLLDMRIDVYGFDLGEGLPEPVDYRDLPYHWQAGFYKMDVDALQARLSTATLVLGDVAETVTDFIATYDPAPIAAISCDLDFYSSTAASLTLFDAAPEHFIPRVFCYFDDTIGSEAELYNDFTGQRLAIAEFNDTHTTVKLAQPAHLTAQPTIDAWRQQIWIGHLFEHPDYGTFVAPPNRQLPLDGRL